MNEKIYVEEFGSVQRQGQWFLVFDSVSYSQEHGAKNGALLNGKKRKLIERSKSFRLSKVLEMNFWTVWTLDE